jgi:hypothetical protein
MLRQDRPNWVETELRFGFAGNGHAAVELELPGGARVLLRGAIDRVDGLPGGGLKVIDYKTGSFRRFMGGGLYNGGRRLQAVLYSAAAERLMGARVERMEYHFPTRKGENERRRFPRSELAGGLTLVERLLDVASSGRFLPTDHAGDCAWCDYKHLCRVRVGRAGDADSALARWGSDHLEDSEYDLVRAVRRFEEGV